MALKIAAVELMIFQGEQHPTEEELLGSSHAWVPLCSRLSSVWKRERAANSAPFGPNRGPLLASHRQQSAK